MKSVDKIRLIRLSFGILAIVSGTFLISILPTGMWYITIFKILMVFIMMMVLGIVVGILLGKPEEEENETRN